MTTLNHDDHCSRMPGTDEACDCGAVEMAAGIAPHPRPPSPHADLAKARQELTQVRRELAVSQAENAGLRAQIESIERNREGDAALRSIIQKSRRHGR